VLAIFISGIFFQVAQILLEVEIDLIEATYLVLVDLGKENILQPKELDYE